MKDITDVLLEYVKEELNTVVADIAANQNATDDSERGNWLKAICRRAGVEPDEKATEFLTILFASLLKASGVSAYDTKVGVLAFHAFNAGQTFQAASMKCNDKETAAS